MKLMGLVVAALFSELALCLKREYKEELATSSQRKFETYSVYEDNKKVGPRGANVASGGRSFSETTWSSHSNRQPHGNGRKSGFQESFGDSYGHSFQESFRSRGGYQEVFKGIPKGPNVNAANFGNGAFPGKREGGLFTGPNLGGTGFGQGINGHHVGNNAPFQGPIHSARQNGNNYGIPNQGNNRNSNNRGLNNNRNGHRHNNARGLNNNFGNFNRGNINNAHSVRNSSPRNNFGPSSGYNAPLHRGPRPQGPGSRALGQERAYGVEKVLKGPNSFGHSQELSYVKSYGAGTGHADIVGDLKHTFNDLLKGL